jgi:hypothetical protein
VLLICDWQGLKRRKERSLIWTCFTLEVLVTLFGCPFQRHFHAKPQPQGWNFCRFKKAALSVGGFFISSQARDVAYWHNSGRYWTKADIGGFWPSLVCPLMMLWTAPALRHRSAIGWLRQSKPH